MKDLGKDVSLGNLRDIQLRRWSETKVREYD